MTVRDGYELDMSSPVSHVATEMEGAGLEGPAPTVEAMAASYRHQVSGDLARIRREEFLTSDSDAVQWLINAAIRELGDQVRRDGDGYRLAKPFGQLDWRGRRVRHVSGDIHARLGDPFNPMTGGVFAENVRIGKGHKSKPAEDDILRESMRQNGWLPGHPAIVDERGVVITGHRRLRIAQELGVEPQIQRMTFGSGDGADIARLKAAWWSNEGTKPYTPLDRQAVAAYLAERGWTQASIAEALHVAHQTISKDLRDLTLISTHGNKGAVQDGKRQRALGAGRPRNLTEEQQEFVKVNYQEFGGTMGVKDLMAALGTRSNTPILKVIDQERGRHDERSRSNGRAPASSSAPASAPTPLEDLPSVDLMKELIGRLPEADMRDLYAWLGGLLGSLSKPHGPYYSLA